ncbi:MAG: CNNM domain-containing protein [Eubacteriales bacterium]|jgi:putative hemolysin
MSDDIIPRFILIIILIFVAAFFAAAETAYSYCNRIRMKTMADDGDRRALKVCRILNEFDGALVTLLVGFNILNVMMSSVATVLAIDLLKSFPALSGYASLISSLIITLIVFIFDGTIPKNIAHVNADKLALGFCHILFALMRLMFPVIKAFQLLTGLISRLMGDGEKQPEITTSEFIRAVDTALESGAIDLYESKLIKSASSFNDLRVNEIMVPRNNIDYFDLNQVGLTNDCIKEKILTDEHTRHPLCLGGLDNIIGIINSSDVLEQLMYGSQINLKSLSRPPVKVRPDIKLKSLFDEMVSKRTHMAVITDITGKTVGLATMDDLLRVLFQGNETTVKGKIEKAAP